MNYAEAMARDKGGEPIQNAPSPYIALTRNAAENATASSVLTLTDSTTAIEIAAQTTAAAMRWIPTSDTQASVISAVGGNFDHIIPVSTVRRFVVPQESSGTSSIVGANIQNGLYRRVAIKSIGVGSVLLTEY